MKQRTKDNAPSLKDQTRGVLDVTTVKAFFAQNAQTAVGKAQVLAMDLLPAAEQGDHYTDVENWYQLLERGPALRFPAVPGPELFEREPHLKPFTREELRDIRDVLVFCRGLSKEERLSFAHGILVRDAELEDLTRSLERMFDKEGHWREDVSSLYHQLIRQFFHVEEQLEQSMRALIRRYASYLNETMIFDRDRRRVLAVKIDFRGRVKGILHDYSSSGNTIYVEPDETIEKQNRLREIEAEVEEELWRIRVETTERILGQTIIATLICPLLARFDTVQALAVTGKAAKCICLRPNDTSQLELRDARHPFLDQLFAPFRCRHDNTDGEDENQMIPFSLSLEDEIYGLIISGANTGGKTVTLKTTGLLAWMANSGFPVPLDEGSQVPFYAEILADIGDNQSLSHNLSTFASHLASLRQVLAAGDRQTLVLLDELGSGTDPNEGNALSQALIEEIVSRRFHLLVTTHQQVLCTLALTHPNLDNGSMAFDAKRLKPIYRFTQGVPGRSHALEIAEDAGLPKSLLARARALIDDDQVDIQAAIGNLQLQHKDLVKQKKKLRRDELKLHQRLKQARAESEKLTGMQEAFREKSLARLNKSVEKAERELRVFLSEATSSKQRRAGLSRFSAVRKEILEPYKEPEKLDSVEVETSDLTYDKWKIGDKVFLKSFRAEGVLTARDRKRMRVDCRGKVLDVDASDVLHLKQNQVEAEPPRITEHLDLEGGALSTELRLLGYRMEDAMLELESTLDGALSRGLPFLKIIHGHGNGVLKKAVREFLRTHNARSNYIVDLDPENDGITEVKFE